MTFVVVGVLVAVGLFVLDATARVLATGHGPAFDLGGIGLAVGVGVVLAMAVAALVDAATRRGTAADRVRAHLGGNIDWDLVGVVAGSVAACIPLASAWWWRAVNLGSVDSSTAATWLAVVDAIGAGVAIVTFVAVRRRVSGCWACGRWISPCVAGLLVCATAVLGVLAVAQLAYLKLVADGVWPWTLALAGMGLTVGLLATRTGAAPAWRRRDVVLVLWGLVAWRQAITDEVFRGRALADNLPARWLADGVRHAWDGDGDGFSPVLGGGDCDDANAARHPMAYDVADNGIDENCDGVDRIAAPSVLADGGTSVAIADTDARVSAVVLITVDSLRPDHLGVYGYDRATSPRIDAWAEHAVVFDRAWSTAPGTGIALPSVMSGRTTSETAWRLGTQPLEPVDGVPLVGDALKRAGVARHVVSTFLGLAQPIGVVRGFDDVDASLAREAMTHGRATAHAVADKAISYIDAHADGTFFLWLHFMEPHSPYTSHTDSPSFGTRQVDHYDAEIRYVDTHVGRVLDHLDARGLGAKTAVILTADHGERKRHDGNMGGHGVLDRASLRIPIIVSVPGVTSRRFDCPVSLKDVAPTVLSLFGLRRAAAELPAVDLLPIIDGESCDARRELVAEKTMRPGGVRGEWTLIGPEYRYYEERLRGVQRLYRADGDDEHGVDLDRGAAVADRMRRTLMAWHAEQEHRQIDEALARVVLDELPTQATRLSAQGPAGIRVIGVDLGPGVVVDRKGRATIRVYFHVASAVSSRVALRYDWGEMTASHRLPVWHLPGQVVVSSLWPAGKIMVDEVEFEFHRHGAEGAAELSVGFEVDDEPARFVDGSAWLSLGTVQFLREVPRGR